MGASWANWSKVKADPFAAMILYLAAWVNLSAATLMPSGRLRSLVSLVTVPTMATILELYLVLSLGTAAWSLLKCLTILEIEMGYLFNLV